MSAIEVYVERRNRDVVPYADVPNAMAGALLIWVTMATDYGLVPPEGSLERDVALGRALSLGAEESKDSAFYKLWKMLPQITRENERDGYVLAMTMHKVLIPWSLCATVGGHLREWATAHGFEGTNGLHTLLLLAGTIEQAGRTKGVVAVGFNHTSVSDPFWLVWDRDDEGEVDDEKGERPYNTRRDTGHWYLSLERMLDGGPKGEG